MAEAPRLAQAGDRPARRACTDTPAHAYTKTNGHHDCSVLLTPMRKPSNHPRLPRPGLAAIVACLTLAGVGIGTPAAAAGSPYPAGVSRPLTGHARTLARVAKAPHPKTKRKKPRKPKLRGNPARALLAFQAMQKYYYIPGSGLYSGEPFSYLWPFSQAFAVTISMAYIPRLPISFSHELPARLVGLDSYLDPNNSGAPEGIYTSTLAGFDGTVAPPAGPGG